jgi:Glycosyltransferases involved in cell wall biogenesis
MDLISLVIPCYNEEESIALFYEEMVRVMTLMEETEFEIIFVNDGSSDRTLELLREYSKLDKRVKYVSLSRNFGKEAAMYAGLVSANGDYVGIMDADLQDPPSLLPEMYRLIKEEGYDNVATRRTNRKGEPPIRSFFANVYYKIINKISSTKMVPGARDYRLMNRKMTDAVLSLCEYNRFTKGIFEWVGFKIKWLEYTNVERAAGETKFSFWKLFKYSLESIIAFSTAPLAIASVIGILFFFISILGIIAVIVRYFMGVGSISGWVSQTCIILFISGIQLFTIGIIGQYLSKTYLETKKRPIFIIAETEEEE